MKSLSEPSGFTMIEVLIALLSASLCALLCVQIASLISHDPLHDYRAEDEIAIKQMRLILAQSQITDVQTDTLSFFYHENRFRLVQYEDKLVKRKGFEVLLQDIYEARFHRENHCVILQYRRGVSKRKVVLTCEE